MTAVASGSVGLSVPRPDAAGKVTGAADYPGDLRPGAVLHAKVVFSGRPHARMVAMDTSAARATPGVVAVLTAADVPVNEYGLTMFDQPVLVGVEDTGRSRVAADVSRWGATASPSWWRTTWPRPTRRPSACTWSGRTGPSSRTSTPP
jgi:CO/xanthine dehydrogenase Mo-binding subunit